MSNVSHSQSISNYLQEVQKLKVLSTNNPEKLNQLLDFVAGQKDTYENTPEIDFLFKGEHAFHSGDYEQALLNYMQAREVPNFEFFCYRATAYVSFIRGDHEKAKSFIQKALDFNPEDFDTLRLYYEILTQNGEQDQADQVKETLARIEANSGIEEPASKKEEAQSEIVGETDMTEADSTQTAEQEVPSTEPFTREDEIFTASPDPKERGRNPDQDATSQFIASKLGVDLESEQALETRIQEFQQSQTRKIQNYLEESRRKASARDFSLYVLNGWSTTAANREKESGHASDILLMEQSRQNCGGFFIRWNGKGIVINPGVNFLENFHKQGLYIGDINYVIATQDSPQAIADIRRIYDFNYQLNKTSPQLHVINYYLNHKAYQDMSHTLKPNFKQERNTVHSLELFLDSPDVEREELAEGIALSYFSTSSRGGYMAGSEYQDSSRSMQPNCVGVRLELTGEAGEPIKLGYVSGTAWSPLLAHHLGHCDILITGFGTTNPNDYGKLNYNENSLGYFGTYTLLEEVKPKLLLCAEFDGREGDIRLEVAKKLRREYQNANSASPRLPSILPADNGLFVDLKSQEVQCSISRSWLEPQNVIVVKDADTYGKLKYLSPNCIL